MRTRARPRAQERRSAAVAEVLQSCRWADEHRTAWYERCSSREGSDDSTRFASTQPRCSRGFPSRPAQPLPPWPRRTHRSAAGRHPSRPTSSSRQPSRSETSPSPPLAALSPGPRAGQRRRAATRSSSSTSAVSRSRSSPTPSGTRAPGPSSPPRSLTCPRDNERLELTRLRPPCRVHEYGGAPWAFESDRSILFSSFEGPAYRVERGEDGTWTEPKQFTPGACVS